MFRVIIFFGILVVRQSVSERCGYTTIAFRTKLIYGVPNTPEVQRKNVGMRCVDFEGATYNPIQQSYGVNSYEGICKVSVCGDGKVHEGHYCGVGPCNIFGSNCEGGCHRGDPVVSFKELYAGKVWDVHIL
ncbi:hypothetical protein HvAV-3i_gp096 [Heliothis virescens ascovirus 3i]|nr:hypothetical protein HvAV-3i_gp096 [Heliothis virescens ascovirus 3i]